MAELYVIGTPIGNLEDITLRALETLRMVDVIACEDTRQTAKLLSRHSIQGKRLLSCRAQNEEHAAGQIIALLSEGLNAAYVSDAGTPGISDPGSVLVRKTRQSGFRVVPIPGVSALTSLASISGVGGRTLVFDGFLSPKAGKRRSRLRELAEREESFILYESPHRIIKLLQDCAEEFPEREIIVGRELTKLHEEVISGPAEEIYRIFCSRERILGEFCVFVSGKKKS